jgi:hypothetical protein
MTNELGTPQQGGAIQGYNQQQMEDMGFIGGVDASKVRFPRAKLMQGLSPEVNNEENAQRAPKDKLSAGMIINSVTKEILPAEFIPLVYFPMYMKFNPRQTNHPAFDSNYKPGEMIWRTNNPLDPRVAETKFGKDGSKPTATSFINFLGKFDGVMLPVIISFCNTSYVNGLNLYNLLLGAMQPLYFRKFKLFSVFDKNEAGSFYKLNASFLGLTDGDERAAAKDTAESYREMIKQIRFEEYVDEHVEKPAAFKESAYEEATEIKTQFDG